MKVMQLPGLRDIRSIHSAGIRSIPKVQRSPHLELYTLSREKLRLEKEIYALDKRTNAAKRQLANILKRMEGLQKEVHQEESIKTYRGLPRRPLKTMAIKY